jgi:glycosyltransferase involved in cell wall biosynthesis
MARLPRISVVTPSFNQGRYLEHTVRSVLDQNYPDVEHVVVDNLSTDETPAVLARHPHLRVIREADRGQAEAINKGFRRTTGEILCFLNSDDRLLPGALHRVARALDPRTGPHVVTGRCPYIDENDRPTGVEHPSAVLGHWRVLKSWQGHWLPQPATFWTRAAWDRCGPLDESEHLVMDYDLMCRLSRHYRFAFIDEPLAAYRLHSESKTCTNDADRINAAALRASKRYWGAYLGPRRWFLVASLIRHRLEAALRLRRRAADLVFRAEAARAAGRPVRALLAQSLAAALAPAVALRRCVRLRRAHRPNRASGRAVPCPRAPRVGAASPPCTPTGTPGRPCGSPSEPNGGSGGSASTARPSSGGCPGRPAST